MHTSASTPARIQPPRSRGNVPGRPRLRHRQLERAPHRGRLVGGELHLVADQPRGRFPLADPARLDFVLGPLAGGVAQCQSIAAADAFQLGRRRCEGHSQQHALVVGRVEIGRASEPGGDRCFDDARRETAPARVREPDAIAVAACKEYRKAIRDEDSADPATLERDDRIGRSGSGPRRIRDADAMHLFEPGGFGG